MSMMLSCTKCHGPIEVSDEVVKEALELGRPMELQHAPGQCVDEDAPQKERTFKVLIQVLEEFDRNTPDPDDPEDWEQSEPELLAQFGGTVKSKNFAEALGPLQNELNKGWEQVQKMAAVIDNG